MLDLIGTIQSQANGNATLSAAVNSDIWYDEAPPNTTMPYIVYTNIGDSPVRCFDTGGDFKEALIQFSIFDRRSAAYAEVIASDLATVFDRKTVIYSSDYHISCELTPGGFGPTRVEDCWQRVVEYLFRFKENC